MYALTTGLDAGSAAADGDSARLPLPFVVTPLGAFAAPLAAPRGTSLSDSSLDSMRGAMSTK